LSPAKNLVYARVVSRKPHAFYRDENNKDYLFVYVTETFECGHSEDFHFLDDAEPLTARRRVCHACSGAFGTIELMSKRRLASIARARERQRKRAA
jgi:hypothetical protein